MNRSLCLFIIITLPIFSNTGFSEEQQVTLLTGNLGNYNYSLQGREFEHKEMFIGGTSTEFISAFMKHSKVPYKMKLRAWNVSYQRALSKNYHGVFSAQRTPDREPNFHWIGPIGKVNIIAYVKRGGEHRISSIEDLKDLRVGGRRGDGAMQYLNNLGITVVEETLDYINAMKLANGYIDVWIAADAGAQLTADKEGYPDIEVAFVLSSSDLFLAMNINTPQHILTKIENSFNALIDNHLVPRFLHPLEVYKPT